jgi:hypothetical protein
MGAAIFRPIGRAYRRAASSPGMAGDAAERLFSRTYDVCRAHRSRPGHGWGDREINTPQ